MAVHPDYPGLTVQVTINGQALLEHNGEDTSADPKVVTKYVEVYSGAEFAIEYAFTKPFPSDKDVATSVYVDGTKIGGYATRHSNLFRREKRVIDGIKTILGGKWAKQCLRFSDLVVCMNNPSHTSSLNKYVLISTAESDGQEPDDKSMRLESLGTLRIDFEFCVRLEKRDGKSVSLPNYETISEKAIKGHAKSLQVG